MTVNNERLHRIGMIQDQPIPHPRAAVMAYQAETVKAEMLHHGELIARHRPLGIGRSVGLLRTAAVPIAPQVCRHHRVMLRQHRREAVPGDMCLRITVQEQQRRPVATNKRRNPCVFGFDIVPFEPLEHGRFFPDQLRGGGNIP
jgi:hypothetical protein